MPGVDQYQGDKISKRERIFKNYYSHLPNSLAAEIGIQAKQLIKSCEFAQDSQTDECLDLKKGRTIFRSPTLGICYSFNYGGIEDNRYKTTLLVSIKNVLVIKEYFCLEPRMSYSTLLWLVLIMVFPWCSMWTA